VLCEGHGHEVALGVVGDLGAQGRGAGEGRAAADEQRVAVRNGPGDQFGADRAGGTGPVVDDHRLPPDVGEARGDEACHHVGRSTRCEGDDPAYGFRGVGGGAFLRAGGGNGETGDQCDDVADTETQCKLLPMPPKLQTRSGGARERPADSVTGAVNP